jgi:uncharacterized protein (UPF0548 family)
VFLLHAPSTKDIERFLAASRELQLSYDPVGLVSQAPAGFRVDEQTTIIGSGEAAFQRATTALARWRHFDLGWVEMFPKQAAVAPGSVVAVAVRHLGFWSLNGCRVVYLVGAPGETTYGFAYGTLTNHAESGEEIFQVSFRPESGDVLYLIRAVSRPRAALARLGYPFTRSLQAKFRRDSARALRRAIGA